MEIWETVSRGKYLHTVTTAHIRRLIDGSYELTIDHEGTGSALSIPLDRKQLKDMFNDLGNELNAWTE